MLVDVVLVNANDEQIGTMEKMEAHQKGLLHRAFSVFVFNSQGQMLLQQRALNKYHSGGLWTNTCCSHPYPNEAVAVAANRRLQEEMGFSTTLTPAFVFTYHAQLDNQLIEHEVDHVFVGTYEGSVLCNPQEVESYCYKTLATIDDELVQQPNLYTEWFKIAYPKLKEFLKLNKFSKA
jgi:isopentenyl-diphosphate Delta-isomerase